MSDALHGPKCLTCGATAQMFADAAKKAVGAIKGGTLQLVVDGATGKPTHVRVRLEGGDWRECKPWKRSTVDPPLTWEEAGKFQEGVVEGLRVAGYEVEVWT